jgi:tRNA (guanine-N7-)-methyltransferase
MDDVFGDKPTRLEIGCGKGEFICMMAQKFPDVDFIAVERNTSVIVVAIEKAKSLDLPNVKFIIADAKNFADYFPGGLYNFIDTVYLNFSDPWHKRRQHDKRLTSPHFLGIYKKIMRPGAKIIMKTDNASLFDYSLKTLPAHDFGIIHKTYDLYNSEFFDADENVQTEYEKKFAGQNTAICYLEAENLTVGNAALGVP